MKIQNIHIKETTKRDLSDIMLVEERAFGKIEEAKLTRSLLKDDTAKPQLSLLAFHEKEAIGHILFTRAFINDRELNQPLLHILAPLAVVPEYQQKGIGELLIKEGLKRLQIIDSKMVFVLGHIKYYPKHGFIPDAKKQGYSAPFPIPEKVKEAWMFQSLSSDEVSIPAGKVICADSINKLEYWKE